MEIGSTPGAVIRDERSYISMDGMMKSHCIVWEGAPGRMNLEPEYLN